MAERVLVVVVTYNSAAIVERCLSSLPAALDGCIARVIVADNSSSDGTLALVASVAPNATGVALGRNGGYAAGVNAGIAAAGPDEAVLVLNPDIRLAPACIRHLMDALSLDATGIAVPRIVDDQGRLMYSLRRSPSVLTALGAAVLGGRRAGRFPPLSEVVARAATYDAPAVADWATGAAMLISRPCLDAVGLWDESFFLYSEETDFALRARDAGFVLRYVPEAQAVHLGGEVSSSPRLWSILTLNRVRLFRRRHGSIRSAAFAGAVALNEALRALGGSARHRAGLASLVFPSRRPPEVATRGQRP